MAIVYFNGARVENVTSSNLIIMPCGNYIPSGGYKNNVWCKSDEVYSDLYETFYKWNSSVTLNANDVGVFYYCSPREVKLRIMHRCSYCLKTHEIVLSANVRTK